MQDNNPQSPNQAPSNPFKPTTKNDPFREPIEAGDLVMKRSVSTAEPVVSRRPAPTAPQNLPGQMTVGQSFSSAPAKPRPPVPPMPPQAPQQQAPRPTEPPRPQPPLPPEPPKQTGVPLPPGLTNRSANRPIFVTPPTSKAFVLSTKTPSTPPPPPPKQPEEEKPKQSANPYLRNLRTYESDIAEHLSARGTSKASMAIAESVKQGQGEVISNSPRSPQPGESASGSGIWKKVVLVVISLILIGAGGIAGYVLFEKSPIGAASPVSVKGGQRRAVALVPYDSQSVIPTDGADAHEIFSRIKQTIAKPQTPATIREVVFTQVKDASTYRATATEMAYMTTLAVPDIIMRTLQPEWMYGIYASADGKQKSSFVVITTNLFQNAFAGMLGWENTILEDLYGAAGDASYDRPKGEFKDKIVRNKDVRAFVTDNGRTVIAYSFIDNGTLVIAEDIETIDTIISRLESKAYVR